MTVNTGKFGPINAQISRAVWYFHLHHIFHRLTKSHTVHEAANTADSFGYIHIIGKFFLRGQQFQTAVNVTYGGNRLNDFFVFQNEVKTQRFRQNRMLGT